MNNVIKYAVAGIGAGALGGVAMSAIAIAAGVGLVLVVGTACAQSLIKGAGDIAIDTIRESNKEEA